MKPDSHLLCHEAAHGGQVPTAAPLLSLRASGRSELPRGWPEGARFTDSEGRYYDEDAALLVNPAAPDSDAPAVSPELSMESFCTYCGGNDETPPDHCMDCTRPSQGGAA